MEYVQERGSVRRHSVVVVDVVVDVDTLVREFDVTEAKAVPEACLSSLYGAFFPLWRSWSRASATISRSQQL